MNRYDRNTLLMMLMGGPVLAMLMGGCIGSLPAQEPRQRFVEDGILYIYDAEREAYWQASLDQGEDPDTIKLDDYIKPPEREPEFASAIKTAL